MKNYKILLFIFLMAPLFTFSQEKAKDSVVEKPERPAFESSSIVDNQTNVRREVSRWSVDCQYTGMHSLYTGILKHVTVHRQ